MSNNNILQLVEKYIYTLYTEKAPSENVYHDLTHTKEVVKAAEKIGRESGLSDFEIENLLIAAWFHDIGYIDIVENHEIKSAEYAKSFLTENDFPSDRIKVVTSAIAATKLPQSPKNKLEEALCDADLHHLGSKKFDDRNELFRLEFKMKHDEPISETEWVKRNIEFFTKHKFFTKYANDKYEEKKHDNFLRLQKKLRKKLVKKEQKNIQAEKLAFEKTKLESKKEFDKLGGRGTETMFRNVMRTHVNFSSMADNKANIMISVNTLLLGAIATILSRKLDTNPHLIIPTIVLTLVSLVTLIYGILATRPQITTGVFSKEDIEKKRANLLFFGNFYKMKLDDFTWGMQSMMNDSDYLYGSMIKDFYFLGQTLGKKYKYLRVCYNIFMYGIVISIIVFAIFIALNPGGTQIGDILE